MDKKIPRILDMLTKFFVENLYYGYLSWYEYSTFLLQLIFGYKIILITHTNVNEYSYYYNRITQ